jgi:hypothetical protein
MAMAINSATLIAGIPVYLLCNAFKQRIIVVVVIIIIIIIISRNCFRRFSLSGHIQDNKQVVLIYGIV